MKKKCHVSKYVQVPVSVLVSALGMFKISVSSVSVKSGIGVSLLISFASTMCMLIYHL